VLPVVAEPAATLAGAVCACGHFRTGSTIQTKETMMSRAFTAASILALTVTAAQAAPANDVKFSDQDVSNSSDGSVLGARAHQFAYGICGQLRQSDSTSLFYQNWFNRCMGSTGATAKRLLEARAGRYEMLARN
jgi:UrcA family protein